MITEQIAKSTKEKSNHDFVYQARLRDGLRRSGRLIRRGVPRGRPHASCNIGGCYHVSGISLGRIPGRIERISGRLSLVTEFTQRELGDR
jgi:hypothetical protein